MVYKCSKKGGPMPPGGVVTPPGHEPPPKRLMTLEEAHALIGGKAASQLWVEIEPYADGYIIPKCLMGLMGSPSGTTNVTNPVYGQTLLDRQQSTSAGAGVTHTLTPAAGETYLIWSIATENTAAADMNLEIVIRDATYNRAVLMMHNRNIGNGGQDTQCWPVHFDPTAATYTTLGMAPFPVSNPYYLSMAGEPGATKYLETFVLYSKV